MTKGLEPAGQSPFGCVELTRRYSNHADHTNSLVRTLELVRAQPTQATGVSRAVASGHRAPSLTGRAKIDPDMVAASYTAGSTLVELAERHGVSESTIKRVLRERGVRKHRRAPRHVHDVTVVNVAPLRP